MIYLYGDSHANKAFQHLSYPFKNYHQSSVTMFRIGRDNMIINYNPAEVSEKDIVIIAYGEVDCRCHIQRQINIGHNEDHVIYYLVYNYFKTMKNNIHPNVKVIVVSVIPPTKQNDYESLHGPITHEFPFVGTDESRVRYTAKMNYFLEEFAKQNGYYFFNPYAYCTRPDGTLCFEMSDTCVHIKDASILLEQFSQFVKENNIIN
jgi:hypothetical protein